MPMIIPIDQRAALKQPENIQAEIIREMAKAMQTLDGQSDLLVIVLQALREWNAARALAAGTTGNDTDH